MNKKRRLLEIALGHAVLLAGPTDLLRGAYSGKETYLYRNSGTYTTPVWDEIKRARNIQITDGPALADVEFHGAGSTSMIPGYKQFSGSIELVRKVGTDSIYTELKDTGESGGIEDWIHLNGKSDQDGAIGWRAPIALGEFAETANGGDPVVATIPIGKADAYDALENEIEKVPVTVTGGVPTFGAMALLGINAIRLGVKDPKEVVQRSKDLVAELVAQGIQTAEGTFLKAPPADWKPKALDFPKK